MSRNFDPSTNLLVLCKSGLVANGSGGQYYSYSTWNLMKPGWLKKNWVNKKIILEPQRVIWLSILDFQTKDIAYIDCVCVCVCVCVHKKSISWHWHSAAMTEKWRLLQLFDLWSNIGLKAMSKYYSQNNMHHSNKYITRTGKKQTKKSKPHTNVMHQTEHPGACPHACMMCNSGTQQML